MPGRALAVTRDSHLERLVQKVSRESGMHIEVDETVAVARRAISQGSFDLIVVDCDDVAGGREFLRDIRASWATKNAAVIAVLNGATSAADALDLGADATLEKFKATALFRQAVLSVCRVLRQREHERVALEAAVSVSGGGVMERLAQAFNISEGGVGLHFDEPILVDDLLTLRFRLPGTSSPLQVRCEIVWATPDGRMGLGFKDLSTPVRNQLNEWLRVRRSRADLRA